MVPSIFSGLSGAMMKLCFDGVVEGYQTTFHMPIENTAYNDSGIQGFVVSANAQRVSLKGQKPIPHDHIAALFHQTLLCGGSASLINGGPLGEECSISLCTLILKQIKTSDLQQAVVEMSNILGRTDRAALDLMHVQDRFSDCHVSLNYDANDKTIVVTIPFMQEVQIKFLYERDDDKSIVFCVPTRVQVVNSDDSVLDDLHLVATEVLTSLSTEAPAHPVFRAHVMP